MFKLVFYVPETHVEAVKSAVFATGAGRIGDYNSCAWQVLGQGQFRPLEGSQPFLGQQGQVEQVPEYRVELVCADELIEKALAALRRAHPYEEPAYDVWRLADM
ncbi:YqfO family protein [Marinimicrobium sp. ABcell2]|uniref:Nif3-like dinuclear metal center hexameric protein n=1 Tax=Marinimicrobium sp. ABcell2 TaxID=3069751 RepID=UPI0027B16DAA|nr:YqfO family protein [Marinimicrobium sp. ABcell2]MDQ2075464.1 YqfO family protein [Marinimicrobium sp. ABcell2]